MIILRGESGNWKLKRGKEGGERNSRGREERVPVLVKRNTYR
jgi:hypothetical protein